MIGILFKHISLLPTSKIETICITLSLILAKWIIDKTDVEIKCCGEVHRIKEFNFSHLGLALLILINSLRNQYNIFH